MDRKLFFKNILPTLSAIQIIEHEVTEDRFIDIFTSIHEQDGSIAYETEKFYFQKILVNTPVIAECTPLSLFSVFLDVATKGLSLDDSSKALCYITSRNIGKKTGKYVNNKPEVIWEKRAILDISGYGELVLRERAGQVKYADNPEIVYINELKDCRQENTPEGVKIYHTINYPRPTDAGIAFIYVRIIRPDGSITFGVLGNERIEELKVYSAENNGKWEDQDGRRVKIPGKPNKLYSDSGFLKAKCLKHAFQSFPTLKLANFSAITGEPESPEELGITQQVYKTSFPDEKTVVVKEAVNEPADNQPETSTPPEPEGVTIKDKNLEMF